MERYKSKLHFDYLSKDKYFFRINEYLEEDSNIVEVDKKTWVESTLPEEVIFY
jgi:hypothetical protein